MRQESHMNQRGKIMLGCFAGIILNFQSLSTFSRSHPPQQHLSRGGIKRHQHLGRYDVVDPDLLSRAISKARWARFPQDAAMGSALGFYEERYKRELQLVREFERHAAVSYASNTGYAAVSDARNTGARTQRDFVGRVAYDSIQIRKLLEVCLAPPASPLGKITTEWDHWQSQLPNCLHIKPDLDFMGWTPLPENK